MDLAIKLSLKAKGLTLSNPLVGAVVVRNNRVISSGYHRGIGKDHAEVVALKKAGKKANGATLYVTLEPCSTYGRTPPCTDSIVKSGIKKVVFGLSDPNPRHNGRAVGILRKQGIEVEPGILKDKIRQINQPFIKYISKNKPYITVKIAQSLDGKIATSSGESKWITSVKSRELSHKLRNNYSAIMVGINTVLKDDPLLNPTDLSKKNKFYKIILDTNLKINRGMRIFKDSLDFPVIIATSRKSILNKSDKIKLLQKNGVMFLGLETEKGLIGLEDLLNKLALLQISSIFVEGGGTLIGSLCDKKLVDYVYFFISPKIIGGRSSISSIQGEGVSRLKDTLELRNVMTKKLDKDLLIEGAIHNY